MEAIAEKERRDFTKKKKEEYDDRKAEKEVEKKGRAAIRAKKEKIRAELLSEKFRAEKEKIRAKKEQKKIRAELQQEKIRNEKQQEQEKIRAKKQQKIPAARAEKQQPEIQSGNKENEEKIHPKCLAEIDILEVEEQDHTTPEQRRELAGLEAYLFALSTFFRPCPLDLFERVQILQSHCRYAVDKYNQETGSKLQYVKALEAYATLVTGTLFHITLQLKDQRRHRITTLLLVSWRRPGGPTTPDVLFCGPRSKLPNLSTVGLAVGLEEDDFSRQIYFT